METSPRPPRVRHTRRTSGPVTRPPRGERCTVQNGVSNMAAIRSRREATPRSETIASTLQANPKQSGSARAPLRPSRPVTRSAALVTRAIEPVCSSAPAAANNTPSIGTRVSTIRSSDGAVNHQPPHPVGVVREHSARDADKGAHAAEIEQIRQRQSDDIGEQEHHAKYANRQENIECRSDRRGAVGTGNPWRPRRFRDVTPSCTEVTPEHRAHGRHHLVQARRPR